jgi:hypothetical protein
MNKKKIVSWVAFCIALVEYAKGDREIPSISIQTNSAEQDVIEVTFRKRSFTITPAGSRFLFQDTEYANLKDAVLAIVKTLNPDRSRPLSDRFINRNVKRATMENGGMKQVCEALRIDTEAQEFLIERYDLAVRTWGLAD